MSKKDVIRNADGSVLVKGSEARFVLEIFDAPTYIDLPDETLGKFCRMAAKIIEDTWDAEHDKLKAMPSQVLGALILMGSLMQKSNATDLHLQSTLTRENKEFGTIDVKIKFKEIK